MTDKLIPFMLSKEDLSLVLDALAERPYKVSAPIIMKMQAQFAEFQRAQRKEKPDGTVPG